METIKQPNTEAEPKAQTKVKDIGPTETELRRQTNKWLKKLEKELKNMESAGRLDKAQYNSLITNMKAYVKDARHFINKGDWVRAFEAVIYAWGILDTARRCNIIKEPERDATSDK